MAKKSAPNKSLTDQFVAKWGNKLSVFDGKVKKSITKAPIQFLDFPENPEALDFFKSTIETFFNGQKSLLGMNKDEKGRMIVFFLIQIAKMMAPKDNNEFLLKVLIPLEKNRIFLKLIGSMVHIDLYTLETGSLNLPETGMFVAPCESNRYTFAWPKSPKEAYLIYVGTDPTHEYSDQDLIGLSYGTNKHDVILSDHNQESSAKTILAQQKKNAQKIGDLCSQMKDPDVVLNFIKIIIHQIPGFKTNGFLKKSVDMALNFWQK